MKDLLIFFVAFAVFVAVYVWLFRKFSLRAVLARAGTAATSAAPKFPAVVGKNGKPISVVFGAGRGVDYKSFGIDKKALLFVKAVGQSAKHRNISDGDICACDTGNKTPNANSMIVVQIKESDSPDCGGFKIREFVEFLPKPLRA